MTANHFFYCPLRRLSLLKTLHVHCILLKHAIKSRASERQHVLQIADIFILTMTSHIIQFWMYTLMKVVWSHY